MNTVYFDWSGGLLTCINNDDTPDKIYYVDGIPNLLATLQGKWRIVSETTFESFEVEQRAKSIRLAMDAGHDWYTTPNRLTGRARRQMTGVTDNIADRAQKTDELDVQVFRWIDKNWPNTLKPVSMPVNDLTKAKLENACTELMKLRRSPRLEMSNRARTGFVKKSAKDEYAKNVIATAGLSRADMTDVQNIVFGDRQSKHKFALSIIAAIAKATKYADSRYEFEQLCGLNVHGFPSQIRSDLMYWSWRRVQAQGVTLSEFRRECRWMYHQLKFFKAYL